MLNPGLQDVKTAEKPAAEQAESILFEGGVDEAGVFHKIVHIDDTRPAEIFAREVLAFLVGRALLGPERAERLLSRRHTGFLVHRLA